MSEIDILSFGETMAMFVAEQTGDLGQVAQFHKRIAGADSNVAIGLSRLGFNVAWLSRVGEDSLGRFVVDTLGKEGIDRFSLMKFARMRNAPAPYGAACVKRP